MAQDNFTETTSTGWFSRIGDSIKGVLVGGVLILVSLILLWWNEGRSVKTAKGLAEGAQVSVEADASKVDASKEGKLVHLVGKSAVESGAEDPIFEVTGPDVIKLRRIVELYQWVEDKKETTRKKVGGGEETVTEYKYQKKWDSKVHDSAQFKHPEGHDNPKPLVEHAEFFASGVTVGAYRVPEMLLSQWNDFHPHPLPTMDKVPEALRGNASIKENWLVLSEAKDQVNVGDARVKFESIKTGDTSLLARQVSDTFEAFTTSYGTSIARIISGVQSKDAMFAAAAAENTFMAWMMRLLGFVLMFAGFSLLFRPLSVLADVLPIAGSIVSAGTGFVALLLAASGSIAVIAVSWLFYRPLLGILLLAVAGGGFYLLKTKFRK